MAGTLTVQNIQGPASGANANKIIIPSGQTLDASAGFVPPAGSIVQIVQSLITGYSTYSTNARVASGISRSITPTSASNDILILINFEVGKYGGSAYGRFWLMRNTSIELARVGGQIAYDNSGDANSVSFGSSLIDSPATTSSVTYSLDVANIPGLGTLEINPSSSVGSITLMEIAG